MIVDGPLPSPLVGAPAPRARHSRLSFGRRFRRDRTAVAGTILLGVVVAAAVLAPWVAPYPLHPVLTGEAMAEAWRAPGWPHLFGTDAVGGDVFTRILYGARTSLTIGFGVALAATALGTVVGVTAAWFGGWVEVVLMRATDLFMVIPGLALVMIVRKDVGESVPVIVATLALLSWSTIARVVRAQVRSLCELEFVEAARASGAPTWRIVVFELLPNLTGVLAVNVGLLVAAAILAETTLSYLGFGLTTSWGRMLAESKLTVGTRLAYLTYIPGLAILLTVLAVNFVGEGLRNAFDPGS